MQTTNPITELKRGAFANRQVPIAPSATVGEPSAPPGAAPCPTCGSAGFWIDVYDGGPHCRGCNPPPMPSLVKHRVWCVGPPGEFRWELEGHRDDAAVESLEELASEFQAFEIVRDGRPTVNVLALRGRVDQSRVGTAGRWQPPLAWAPVGDLTFEEWAAKVEQPWPNQPPG